MSPRFEVLDLHSTISCTKCAHGHVILAYRCCYDMCKRSYGNCIDYLLKCEGIGIMLPQPLLVFAKHVPNSLLSMVSPCIETPSLVLLPYIPTQLKERKLGERLRIRLESRRTTILIKTLRGKRCCSRSYGHNSGYQQPYKDTH